MKKNLLMCLLALGITSYANADQLKVTSTQIPVVSLGENYYTPTNVPLGGVACLKFDPNNYSLKNPQATLDFAYAQELSQIENILDVNINGSTGWGIFSKEARFNYVKSLASDAYDINVSYVFDYKARAVLNLDADKTGIELLSANGLAHYNGTPENFLANCGDSFIKEADAGAALVVTYKLHFANQIERDAFNAKFKKDVAIQNIASEIEAAETNSKTNVSVSLNAIQVGGHPERLQGILGTVSKDGYPAVNCGQSVEGRLDLTACRQVVTNIINYAHAQGAYAETGLEKQIVIDNGHAVDSDALFYMNPVAVKWSQINVEPGFNPQPSPEVLKAQAEITKWYDEDTHNLVFLQHYIPFLQAQGSDLITLGSLTDIVNQLKQRIASYNALDVMACFVGGRGSDCLNVYYQMQNIRDVIYPVDQTIVDHFNTAFPSFANGSPQWLYPIGNIEYRSTHAVTWRGYYTYNAEGNLIWHSVDGETTADGILYPDTQYQFKCYSGEVYRNNGTQYFATLCKQPNPM